MQQGTNLRRQQNKEALAEVLAGKVVTLNIEDMVKAHPFVKGVLTSYREFIERNEPIKANRPKISLQVKDVVEGGVRNIMTPNSVPSEPTRILKVIVTAEKNKTLKTLIAQSFKVNNTLGIFNEKDTEAERAVAMAIEGMVTAVFTQFAVIGAVTAVNNSFYE